MAQRVRAPGLVPQPQEIHGALESIDVLAIATRSKVCTRAAPVNPGGQLLEDIERVIQPTATKAVRRTRQRLLRAIRGAGSRRPTLYDRQISPRS